MPWMQIPALVFLTAPRQAVAVSARAWVNPLNYQRVREGDGEVVTTVFGNMDDAERAEDVQELIHVFAERERDWRGLLARNRRKYLKGTSDCNTSLEVGDYSQHADLLVEHGFGLTRAFLNVGGSDGVSEDPTWRYARKYGASGVYFEMDPDLCRAAEVNLEGAHVVVCQEVTPTNIVGLLEEHVAGVRSGQRHFDLIKIDIDSHDAPVLEELLRNHFNAKHVLLEVNPAVPPPYRFATLFHPELFRSMLNAGMRDWPLRGMSLSHAIATMSRHGYDFVTFAFHDAIFVNRAYRGIYGFTTPVDEFDCYHKAFIMSNGVPLPKTRRWFYEVDAEEGLGEIFAHMVNHSMNEAGYPFPFTLQVD